ncbi:PotD/PotF family extracellular solute-binding protein [Candidatus Dependentiae bacterium]
MNNFLKFEKKTLLRTMIVFAWLVIFAFFVYAPKIFKKILPQERSVTVYLITSIIDSSLLDKFERETGIRVRVKYFEFNSAMQTQMEMTGGVGYDVITPSDYTVDLLRKSNLLQKIDKSKIKNFKHLDKRLTDRSFDPGNSHSIPVCWSAYGIAYNKAWFGDLPYPESLAVFFEPEKVWHGPSWEKRKKLYRVCVMDDPRDVIFLGSLYLYGTAKDFSKKRLAEIKKLLAKQKKWVGGYADSNLPYYLSGVYPVAFATASVMTRMIKESYEFGFVLPKEGSIITIENLAIPVGAKNVEEAHMFIDFLIAAKAQAESFEEYGFSPSNKGAYRYIDKVYLNNPAVFPKGKLFEKLHPIHSGLSVKDAHELWTDIKSR